MGLGKMKLICTLVVALLSVAAMSIDGQDNSERLKRFVMGRKLGDCLLRGCIIFSGSIKSVGRIEKEPPTGDPLRAMMTRKVSIQVGEWLYGRREEKRVELRYAARPTMTKTSLGPWEAWEGVRLAPGAQLIVILWLNEADKPIWQGKPDGVALVVSDSKFFDPIREIAAQQKRFEHNPGEANKITELLAEKEDSLIKGYLLTYLMDGEGAHDTDRAARTLSGLLNSDQLPEYGRGPIADWLASTFYRFNNATRQAVTEAVVTAASAESRTVADPAISVLVSLGDNQMLNMKPYLSQELRRRLAKNYQGSQAANTIPKGHREFESQLGLR